MNKMSVNNSSFVISLDFEMFWGVSDSKTIDGYSKNIEGVWKAIPIMLSIFKKYDIHVTWATVGMLMCKDYRQWSELRPSRIASYRRDSLSTYSLENLAKDFPNLFFGRPLVDQILSKEGQELASHTYSHFYCDEHLGDIEPFIFDIECGRMIFDEIGVRPTSFVFPRNQVREEYLKVLSSAGFTCYRGNQQHWMYQHGSSAPYGALRQLGRLGRFADDYFPLTGSHAFKFRSDLIKSNILNIPASRFLRPSRGVDVIDRFHVATIKKGMSYAARNGMVFHLWWHPHNFGINLEKNIANLECILRHYLNLRDLYGMSSLNMGELMLANV